MARTSAQVQTEIDALRAAMATGVLQVRTSDRTIVYRSLEEMVAALERLEAELAGLLGTNRVRQIRFRTGTGL